MMALLTRTFDPFTRSVRGAPVRSALGVIVVAAVATVTVLVTARGGPTEGGPVGVPPLLVEAAPVRYESSYTLAREFVGQMRPARSSQLSFERGGKVNAVLVNEGESVEAGQEIAALDVELLASRREVLVARLESERALLLELRNGPRSETIDAARAEVEQLRTQVRLDRIEAGRATRLYAERASPEEDRDRRVLGLAVSEARLRAAEANLAELVNGTRPERIDAQRAAVRQTEAEIAAVDLDIEKSRLRAPFAGVVGRRFLDEGRVIAAGEPVVDLLEMGRLEARIGVAGPAAELLSVGQEHRVRWRGRDLPCTVKAIRPDLQSATRSVVVLFSIPEAPPGVRGGDVVAIRTEDTSADAGVWLPVGALTEGVRGLWVCYVAMPLDDPEADGATHRLEARDLEILHHLGDRVFVRGPLTSGERAVTGGLHRLTAGLRVRLDD